MVRVYDDSATASGSFANFHPIGVIVTGTPAGTSIAESAYGTTSTKPIRKVEVDLF